MKMDHGVVFSKPGIYAGWPANHGAWSWGNELLVGFLTGTYGRAGSMHDILPPFKKLQARSLDGGVTWQTEEPNVSFDCPFLDQNPLPKDFSLDGSYILRVCGTYDHGAWSCWPGGGFYHSKDRGKTWQGPSKFDGLEKLLEADGFLCTARTRVDHGLIYLSAGFEDMWGTDYSFCASFEDGRFQYRGTVCDDSARAVMPAAVTFASGRRLAVLRRRKTAVRHGWVESFSSDDDGHTWRPAGILGSTGGSNGNPPALLKLPDERLVAAFGNRDTGSMEFRAWSGGVWFNIGSRLNARTVDIGYPQLFLDDSGMVTCVYYWTRDDKPQQHIAYTRFHTGDF